MLNLIWSNENLNDIKKIGNIIFILQEGNKENIKFSKNYFFYI